jgi:hypothetical protein
VRCFGLPLYNAFTREALAARLGLLPFSAIIDNVRYWHKADMPQRPINVCFRGQSGHHSGKSGHQKNP